MLYLDTSVLVPLVVPELMSDTVERWFSGADPASLATSGWAAVEFASAVGNKVRRGDLSEAEGQAALGMFATRVVPLLRSVPVQEADFGAAASMLAAFGLALRGGDALHLAIASRIGATLVTLDHRLAAAARARGVGVDEPEPVP